MESKASLKTSKFFGAIMIKLPTGQVISTLPKILKAGEAKGFHVFSIFLM